MLVRLILAWVLLSGVAFAQSQAPIPSSRETSGEPQSQAAGNQSQATEDTRGTEKNPIIVRRIRSKEETAADEADHFDKATTERWNIILGVGAVGGAFLQALIFIVMLRTSQRQLRAYLSIEMDENMRPILNEGGRTVIPLMIRNRGQTPAYKVHQWITVDILPEPFPRPTPNPKDPKFSYVSLGPGQAIPTFGVLERAITEEEGHLMIEGTSKMFIWGTVYYRDAFAQRFWRRHKRTEFRLELDVNKNGTSSGLRFCEDGNHAT